MKQRTYDSARALVGHASGPLTGYLDPFVAWLIEQQYRASVIYIKARHGLALDRWLARRRIALVDFGEAQIERYQNRRRQRRRRVRAETRRIEREAVAQLLEFLRAGGACPPARVVATAVDDVVALFEQHLRDRQGLASTTIERYCRITWQFLQFRYGQGAVDLHQLRAGDAIAFVKHESRD